MNALELKFKEGQWVKLIQSPEQKMLVVKNEEVLRSAIAKPNTAVVYTGKVRCSWTERGQQKEEFFYQDALELA